MQVSRMLSNLITVPWSNVPFIELQNIVLCRMNLGVRLAGRCWAGVSKRYKCLQTKRHRSYNGTCIYLHISTQKQLNVECLHEPTERLQKESSYIPSFSINYTLWIFTIMTSIIRARRDTNCALTVTSRVERKEMTRNKRSCAFTVTQPSQRTFPIIPLL